MALRRRDALSSVREYDSTSDRYCVARDEVVSFDFETGNFSGAIVNCSDLFGQALEFFG
jgi:hypothetical protein